MSEKLPEIIKYNYNGIIDKNYLHSEVIIDIEIKDKKDGLLLIHIPVSSKIEHSAVFTSDGKEAVNNGNSNILPVADGSLPGYIAIDFKHTEEERYSLVFKYSSFFCCCNNRVDYLIPFVVSHYDDIHGHSLLEFKPEATIRMLNCSNEKLLLNNSIIKNIKNEEDELVFKYKSDITTGFELDFSYYYDGSNPVCHYYENDYHYYIIENKPSIFIDPKYFELHELIIIADPASDKETETVFKVIENLLEQAIPVHKINLIINSSTPQLLFEKSNFANNYSKKKIRQAVEELDWTDRGNIHDCFNLALKTQPTTGYTPQIVLISNGMNLIDEEMKSTLTSSANFPIFTFGIGEICNRSFFERLAFCSNSRFFTVTGQKENDEMAYSHVFHSIVKDVSLSTTDNEDVSLLCNTNQLGRNHILIMARSKEEIVTPINIEFEFENKHYNYNYAILKEDIKESRGAVPAFYSTKNLINNCKFDDMNYLSVRKARNLRQAKISFTEGNDEFKILYEIYSRKEAAIDIIKEVLHEKLNKNELLIKDRIKDIPVYNGLVCLRFLIDNKGRSKELEILTYDKDLPGLSDIFKNIIQEIYFPFSNLSPYSPAIAVFEIIKNRPDNLIVNNY